MNDQPPLDLELADRLRALSEARIQAEIAAAVHRRQAEKAARDAQSERRRYGVQKRNRAREARLKPQPPEDS